MGAGVGSAFVYAATEIRPAGSGWCSTIPDRSFAVVLCLPYGTTLVCVPGRDESRGPLSDGWYTKARRRRSFFLRHQKAVLPAGTPPPTRGKFPYSSTRKCAGVLHGKAAGPEPGAKVVPHVYMADWTPSPVGVARPRGESPFVDVDADFPEGAPAVGGAGVAKEHTLMSPVSS